MSWRKNAASESAKAMRDELVRSSSTIWLLSSRLKTLGQYSAIRRIGNNAGQIVVETQRQVEETALTRYLPLKERWAVYGARSQRVRKWPST